MLVAGTIFPRGGPSANDLDHLALSRMLCPVCAVAYGARFTAARYFAEYDNDSVSRYAPPSPTPVYAIVRWAERSAHADSFHAEIDAERSAYADSFHTNILFNYLTLTLSTPHHAHTALHDCFAQRATRLGGQSPTDLAKQTSAIFISSTSSSLLLTTPTVCCDTPSQFYFKPKSRTQHVSFTSSSKTNPNPNVIAAATRIAFDMQTPKSIHRTKYQIKAKMNQDLEHTELEMLITMNVHIPLPNLDPDPKINY